MPQKSQTIAITGYDADTLQAIAYGTLERLGWNIKYAGNKNILAYTQRSWKKYSDEITVMTEQGQLTVTSKMTHGEIFDLMGRNKKHIEEFLTVFGTIKTQATEDSMTGWKEKINVLKEDTMIAAQQQVKQAGEVDKVMNFSKSNLYITYGIVALNVLVFVFMAASGVDLFAPKSVDIIKWGANYAPLTLSGDWWRLISCVFIHIGFIHLAFNMYALYMVGVYLEPMLGKTRYAVAYLCTGVFASLASLWWHKVPVPSAGASGAIFGMYGVFLALLSTNLIPKQIRNGLLQSIGIFVVYNLAYGMKSGIDNAAHIGGLLSGFVIGYLYYTSLKDKGIQKKQTVVIAASVIVTIAATVFYLEGNKATGEERARTKSEIDMFDHKDAEVFNAKYDSIIEMQNRALVPLNDATLNNQQLAEKLERISLPEWENADRIAKDLKTYNVSEKAKQKAAVMQQYINLRKEQINLILKLINEKDEKINLELKDLNDKIEETIGELNKL